MPKKTNKKEAKMIDGIMDLFDGRFPAVGTFKEILSGKSKEEQEDYYRTVYQCSLSEWTKMTIKEKTFVVRLLKNQPQRYLDFLLADTVLGEITYELRDPLTIIHFIESMEKLEPDRIYSRHQMLFAFSRSFYTGLKISSLREMERQRIKHGEADRDGVEYKRKKTNK